MLRTAIISLTVMVAGLQAAAQSVPAVGAIPPLVEPWRPSNGDVINFKVLRQGSDFGTHSVSFSTLSDGTLKAETRVKLKAGAGPITLFRYSLSAVETWQRGKLVGVAGTVNEDGKAGNVAAVTKDGKLAVNGTVFSGSVTPDILPASHWNLAQTRATELLSTEDGEIIKVKVSKKGEENVKIGKTSIKATRYLMDSDIDVDLWYDERGRWVKLGFKTRGQNIEYVLTQLYD
jgi:Family of unknown function (DUF6134)